MKLSRNSKRQGADRLANYGTVRFLSSHTVSFAPERSEPCEKEVLSLDEKLRHEREKLADIELFIAGGALDPMKPAAMR